MKRYWKTIDSTFHSISTSSFWAWPKISKSKYLQKCGLRIKFGV